jgi:hypothetical protein
MKNRASRRLSGPSSFVKTSEDKSGSSTSKLQRSSTASYGGQPSPDKSKAFLYYYVKPLKKLAASPTLFELRRTGPTAVSSEVLTKEGSLGEGWWRERDSNPRCLFQDIHDFQSCSFGLSDTSPCGYRYAALSFSRFFTSLWSNRFFLLIQIFTRSLSQWLSRRRFFRA